MESMRASLFGSLGIVVALTECQMEEVAATEADNGTFGSCPDWECSISLGTDISDFSRVSSDLTPNDPGRTTLT